MKCVECDNLSGFPVLHNGMCKPCYQDFCDDLNWRQSEKSMDGYEEPPDVRDWCGECKTFLCRCLERRRQEDEFFICVRIGRATEAWEREDPDYVPF